MGAGIIESAKFVESDSFLGGRIPVRFKNPESSIEPCRYRLFAITAILFAINDDWVFVGETRVGIASTAAIRADSVLVR